MHATQARRFTATLPEAPMKNVEATLKMSFIYIFQQVVTPFDECFEYG